MSFIDLIKTFAKCIIMKYHFVIMRFANIVTKYIKGTMLKLIMNDMRCIDYRSRQHFISIGRVSDQIPALSLM